MVKRILIKTKILLKHLHIMLYYWRLVIRLPLPNPHWCNFCGEHMWDDDEYLSGYYCTCWKDLL